MIQGKGALPGMEPRGRRTVLFAPEMFNAGEVTRGVEVARHLGEHVECVFAGYCEHNRDLIEDAGFELRLLNPRLTDDEARALLALDQGRGLRNPYTDEMLTRRVASERALIRELEPAAVVIGATMSQLISARAERVPLVFVRPFAYSLAHVEAVRLRRATGTLSRATVGQRAADRVAARLAPAVVRGVGMPGAFRRVARASGVPLPRGIVRAMTADLNLITTPDVLLPSWVTMPSGHRLVGPVYAKLPGELPEVVGELAAGNEPMVYVAMGSSGSRELVTPILRGLGSSRYQVLAPVRELLHERDLAGLPDNVHVTERLPAHRLGGMIDLAITHGGEGTVQNSCTQGWPFIGVPLQLEQRFNIQRCVDFGSAWMVPSRRVPSTDWPGLVSAALADRCMLERAALLAGRLARIDGPRAAAAAILELV